MRFPSALSLVALALIAGGCLHDGGTETVTVRETVTETGPTGTVPDEAPAILSAFLLRDGKVAPVARSVVTGPEVGRVGITELLMGPTTEEGSMGFETAIPAGTELGGVSIKDGIADVELSRTLDDPAGQAQVVYTLTQFPTVERVRFLVEGEPQGTPRGRAAYEAQTPLILVLSPLPGEDVEPGFEVSGTANTFEANFNYELRNSTDKILSMNFVTATSGSGTRGTFRFTVPYEVDSPQDGRLVVFESSAADGSRINEVSTPLRLR
ncbi:MAG: GerMN domain-containing protein [Actinomycetota bacterium]|nr:GerMN domain-containing protein [Actinomycetota bacterium]